MNWVVPIAQGPELFRKTLNAILAEIAGFVQTPAVSGSVATTDATATTIATVAIPTATTVMVSADIVARRTGGSSGTAGDGAAYRLMAAVKNISGTLTIISQSLTFTAEDQAAWTAAAAVSGTNLLIKVTGAANNNVDWTLTGVQRSAA
jgi:hypothetical protein